MIDYSPVSAIASAASDVALNRRRQEDQDQSDRAMARAQQLAQAQGEQNYRYADMTQRNNQFHVEQDYRERSLAQSGQEADARNQQNQDELQFRYDQMAEKDPETVTDETGATFEATPDEARKIRNLAQIEKPGTDAYTEGIRKIFGQPPSGLTDYTTSDGQNLRVTPSQAAGFKLREDAAAAKAEKDAAAADERSKVHADLIGIQNQRIDLEAEHNALLDRKANAEELNVNQKAMDKLDEDEQKAREAVARNEVKTAIAYRDDYSHAKGASLQADDPELKRRQDIARQAIVAERAVIQQGADALAKKQGQRAAPAGTTTAPASAVKIATNPKTGEKLQFNPNTKQWEPLK